MSSTLLYRAFGFRQYQCQRTTTDDGVLTLHLVQDPKHDRCSYCQSPDVIRRGVEERTVRTVPIVGKPVELRLPVPRLHHDQPVPAHNVVLLLRAECLSHVSRLPLSR